MSDVAEARPLGIWMCTALVVGNMIGSGTFLLPAALAPFGWNAVFGWLATIAGAMSIAFVFARLAPALPVAGGPYAFARIAFGPMLGFAVAWTYWLGVIIGNAAIAIGSVSYLALIFPVIARLPVLPPVLTVSVIWGFTLLNCLGAKSAGRFQLVSTIIKVMPLVGVVGIALYLMITGSAVPSIAFHAKDLRVGGIMATAALTLWALVGLESATVPTDKVRDPKRTIPRATLIGTAVTGLLYLVACSSVQLLMPAGQIAASSAPFADFLSRYLGGNAGLVIAGCAAFSGFGCLNGWVLMQGELPRAMAADGIFPRWFAKTTRNGTPVRAHLVASGILTATVMLNFNKSMIDLFTFLALLGTITALVAYLFTALAALRLQQTRTVETSKALIVISIFAALYAVLSVIGAGRAPMVWGGLFFLSALFLYPVMRWFARAPMVASVSGSAA